MALPTAAELATLDYAVGGLPFARTEPEAAVNTQGLDYAVGGLPFAMGSASFSTVNVLATQEVVEVLRDANPTVGLFLRETHQVKEVLSVTSQNNYITHFVREILRTGSAETTKGVSWMVFDDVHTFDVWLPHGTLSSAVDDLAVLNGANMCLLGRELLQFRDVTSLGSGVYRLSHLLRGRFGTEWAMDQHSEDDLFVLLSTATTYRMHGAIDDLSKTYLMKAVTAGQSVEGVTPEVVINTGVGLKPYAPCHVTGTRDGSDNLTIAWVRRSRITGGWNDYGDVPLGEATESYEVDILASDGTVLRTLTSTSESVVYSAANQTTDFGAPQPTVVCRVYQVSQTVGRGYGARAVL